MLFSRSQVIDYLIDRHRHARGDVAVCFSYFTLSDASFDSLKTLILALYKHLCEDQVFIPKFLLQAKHEHRSPFATAKTENLITLASCYQRIYVVVDGLDECPDKEQQSVLDFFEAVLHATPVFKIFVTSRQRPDVDKRLHYNKLLQVTTGSDDTSSDIESYVREKATMLRQKKKLFIKSDALFDVVVSTLVQKADGM